MRIHRPHEAAAGFLEGVNSKTRAPLLGVIWCNCRKTSSASGSGPHTSGRIASTPAARSRDRYHLIVLVRTFQLYRIYRAGDRCRNAARAKPATRTFGRQDISSVKGARCSSGGAKGAARDVLQIVSGILNRPPGGCDGGRSGAARIGRRLQPGISGRETSTHASLGLSRAEIDKSCIDRGLREIGDFERR